MQLLTKGSELHNAIGREALINLYWKDLTYSLTSFKYFYER